MPEQTTDGEVRVPIDRPYVYTGSGRTGTLDADPNEPTTDTRLEAPPQRVRRPCPHCEGTGFVKTANDMLRESLALLGDAGDDVVREFYRRLLIAAPDLAFLFPADLATPRDELGGDTAGTAQRDKLLGALVALSKAYDPDTPEAMEILDTHLAAFGRSHAAFERKDGSVSGATLEEYGAVKSVLFGVITEAAGADWKPEYTTAWSEAYDYAASSMMVAARRSGFRAPRQPRR